MNAAPTCPWAFVMIWLVMPAMLDMALVMMGVEVRELRNCGWAPKDAALIWAENHNMCEQRRKLNHTTRVINRTGSTIFILTMAGLMESPAVCRAATDMLDWETVVVGDVAWAAAIWAAVTWAEVTCMGCEVTCCTAACTGCMDAAWGWNIAGVFACSWGWTEFRTVAAEWKISLLTGSSRHFTNQPILELSERFYLEGQQRAAWGGFQPC